MSGENVVINLTPSNGHPDIKKYVKGENHDKIGLIATVGKDIRGVNQMLRLTNAAYKLYKEKV